MMLLFKFYSDVNLLRSPFHKRVFHRNSNSMEISFLSHLDSNAVIATTFCTWHDSCAAVACAKSCCDLMASNEIMARQRFHWIGIAGKIKLVKRAPGPRISCTNILCGNVVWILMATSTKTSTISVFLVKLRDCQIQGIWRPIKAFVWVI